jgi:hypothetical protein
MDQASDLLQIHRLQPGRARESLFFDSCSKAGFGKNPCNAILEITPIRRVFAVEHARSLSGAAARRSQPKPTAADHRTAAMTSGSGAPARILIGQQDWARHAVCFVVELGPSARVRARSVCRWHRRPSCVGRATHVVLRQSRNSAAARIPELHAPSMNPCQS